MGDQNKRDKAHRPIHRIASAYDVPKISTTVQPHHDTIVELLIRALTPIGAWRDRLPKPAKTSSKKRKRKAASGTKKSESDSKPVQDIPEAPPIRKHTLLGFNAVTRHLEDLSKYSNPTSMEEKDNAQSKPRQVAVVFLFRALDDLIYSHLPTLCQIASLAYRDLPRTRLILLDQSVEKKVVASIRQARGASMLAILHDASEAEGATALLDYARENVEPVEVPWIKQASEAKWLGTRVEVQ